jgi:hypothetical protein
MEILRCCLCFANGEERIGATAEGQPLPLCDEHRAQQREDLAKRDPSEPLFKTPDGDDPESLLVRHAARELLVQRREPLSLGRLLTMKPINETRH